MFTDFIFNFMQTNGGIRVLNHYRARVHLHLILTIERFLHIDNDSGLKCYIKGTFHFL